MPTQGRGHGTQIPWLACRESVCAFDMGCRDDRNIRSWNFQLGICELRLTMCGRYLKVSNQARSIITACSVALQMVSTMTRDQFSGPIPERQVNIIIAF